MLVLMGMKDRREEGVRRWQERLRRSGVAWTRKERTEEGEGGRTSSSFSMPRDVGHVSSPRRAVPPSSERVTAEAFALLTPPSLK